MSILNIFKRIDRSRWFVCHNCLMHTSHDTLNSVFYSDRPMANVVGRPTMVCPRCNDANTRSFQELKEEGSESALWGLERVVRKHPRSRFVVKASSHTTPAAAAPGSEKVM